MSLDLLTNFGRSDKKEIGRFFSRRIEMRMKSVFKPTKIEIGDRNKDVSFSEFKIHLAIWHTIEKNLFL